MTKIRTNIHLTEDQIKKLTRLAKKEKVTRAEMIRRSIDSLAEKRIGAISICSNAQSRIYCRIPSRRRQSY